MRNCVILAITEHTEVSAWCVSGIATDIAPPAVIGKVFFRLSMDAYLLRASPLIFIKDLLEHFFLCDPLLGPYAPDENHSTKRPLLK